MMPFCEALAAALIIPLLVGYPIGCMLQSATGLRRIVWGGVFGAALLIVVLRSAQYLIPLATAVWWLTPVWVFAAAWGWSRPNVRRAIRRDVAVITRVGACVLVLCVLAQVVVLNLPILLHHFIAFEGTGNNDSVLYITNARWMQQHRFFDPPDYSPSKPLYLLVRGFFGAGLGYRRVGAEAFLAYVSGLIGRDPVYAYNAVLSAGGVWASLAALLIIPARTFRQLRNGFQWGWILPVFFCTPALVYVVVNTNYACAFGIVFFAGYVLTSARNSNFGWRRVVASVLLLAAMAATYPELIPVAWLTLGLALLAAWRLGRSLRLAFIAGVQIATESLIAAAVFSWLTISAFFTIANAHVVSNQMASQWPDIYAGLPPFRYAIAFLTINRSFAEWLPLSLCALTLLAVLWLALSALARRGVRQSLLIGIAAAFAVMTAYIYFHSFFYGEIKIVEYFAVYMAGVAVLGGFPLRGVNWKWRVGSHLAFGVVFLMSLGAGFFWVRDGIKLGGIKHVSPAMVALAEKVESLPSGDVISFGPTPAPFYYAMWFPYLLPQRTFLFGDGDLDAGYFHDYLAEHPSAITSGADYEIESAQSPAPDDGRRIVGTFGEFRLVEPGPLTIIRGAYAQENGFRWLGQSVTFRVKPGSGNFLDLALASRYRPQHEFEQAIVLQNGERCAIALNTQRATLSIPVRGAKVTLEFSDPAVSPSQFGSEDRRKLTFRLLSAEVSGRPKYPIVSCVGTGAGN